MHDNTCKTNCYNHPLSIFVAPDNNLKTQIVAQAIVDNETQSSYEWVFNCILNATGLEPKVLITDGDLAVNGSVIAQFPNAFHIYCIWHISQNLPKNLKGIIGSSYDNFMKDFYTMRNSLTEEKFNESRYFTAGVQSTFRNEGENSTLKCFFGSSSLSLCELFDALEKKYQEEIDYCKEICLISIDDSRYNEVDKSEQCIDNLFDCPQIQLKSLLNDFSTILEFWE
ncbi:8416_t:CDS:2, partial [Cetraspora pellucida]